MIRKVLCALLMTGLLAVLLLSPTSCSRRSHKGGSDVEMADSGKRWNRKTDRTRSKAVVLPALETGVWYRVEGTPMGPGFIMVESWDTESVTGSCYFETEGPVAPRRTFAIGTGDAEPWISYNGGASENLTADLIDQMTFERYEAPEFTPVDCRQMRETAFPVKVTRDVEYGHAQGFWTSLPGVEEKNVRAFTEGYMKSFKKRDLRLTMDIYEPVDCPGPKPLILLFHGGAFYIGDKGEPAYVDFGNYFASMGYVAASIDYRLGFRINKGAILNASNDAALDAQAALDALLKTADEHGIDSSRVFLAGSSAGAMIALKVAYEKRPKNCTVRAVGNMWGAVSSLDVLHDSSCAIASFHGSDDTVVPYDEGYPIFNTKENIDKRLSEKLYGSASITREARKIGLPCSFHTFDGEGHALNTTGKEKTPNAWQPVIRSEMSEFFYRALVPEDAVITSDDKGNYILGNVDGDGATWNLAGGFMIRSDGRSAKVLWRSDVDNRSLRAAGMRSCGLGYDVTVTESEAAPAAYSEE